ncbi:MAG TPA: GH1 family beta-glucosidase [Acidimicrobiia bacterium]|nr:GH1 family beta-glucosidase [Acidimicrobiia bacterium]
MTRPFVWGVATSAFQIEGARHVDGKGESIWDRFADEGRLRDGGESPADHYHRLEEDLELLAGLGVDAYRFSTAWTRVIPDGDGEVNHAGIRFYRRLIDGLVERGIEPFLTLYHWDLPQALQDRGGWTTRETIDAFARYARIMAEELGDGVGRWITHNEPWVTAFLGHRDGVFAPGMTGWETGLTAGHNLMVSHGRATQAIRDVVSDARVGIALDCRPSVPADENSVDTNRYFDGFRNRWFFDPVFGHGYPEDMVDDYTRRGHLRDGLATFVSDGDLEEIAAPIDFLGLNYYTTLTITAGADESNEPEGPVGPDPLERYTEMGWRNDPGGLNDFLARVSTDYGPQSILVTENGASYSDGPDEEGNIDDRRRIEYLDSHIAAVMTARGRGIPVDGYFAWSLLDNLEWIEGLSQRFGLVWIDEHTGERIPKASYHWYRQRIEAAR